VLIVVGTGSVFNIQHRYQATFAAAINSSGLQRMLTVRLAGLARDLVEATETASRERLRSRLLGFADTLEDKHEMLEAEASEAAPWIIALYFEQPTAIDEKVHRYAGAVRKLAKAPAAALTQGNRDYRTILESFEALVETFDEETRAWQTLAEKNTEDRNMSETVSLAAFLIALSILILTVFRPAFRLLHQEMAQLTDLTETLEARVEDRTREAKQNHERLVNAIESLNDGFILFDADDRLVLCNSRNKEFYPEHAERLVPGISFEDLVRNSVMSGEIKDAVGREEDFIRERMARHKQGAKRHEVLRTDGRWLLQTDRITEHGEMVGIRTDITELKNREMAIRESEERFSKAFRASPALFTISTPEMDDNVLEKGDSVFFDASDTWLEAMGFAREEVIGKSMKDLGIWVDWEERSRMLSQIKEKGAGNTIEYSLLTKDGEPRHFLGSGDLIEIGGKTNILLVSQDVTDLRKSRNELNRFKTTLDLTQDCVFMCDPKTLKFFYANQGALEQVGYSKEELLEMTPFDITSESDETQFRKHIEPLIEGPRRSKRFETIHRAKDGSEIPVEIALQYVAPRDEDPRFVAIVRDITNRREAQELLLRSHEELELKVDERTLELRQATMEADTANRAKSEFLANMSHELRTPLNAIIGFSSVIKAETFGPVDNEKYMDYVSDIQLSGQHLLNVINDILDVSAIEAGKLQLHESEVHLRETVDASLQMVRTRAELGSVELLNHTGGGAPVIRADRLRIMQILVNLLSNAVKFTRDGGLVTVSTEIRGDNSALITVTDTGIGMNAADLEKALEMFGQTGGGERMQGGEGTGLGLPLTKGLIEAHGGLFEIDSMIGRGTTVQVCFPPERTIAT
jgi:PAS domain S-box-containing protein